MNTQRIHHEVDNPTILSHYVSSDNSPFCGQAVAGPLTITNASGHPLASPLLPHANSIPGPRSPCAGSNPLPTMSNQGKRSICRWLLLRLRRILPLIAFLLFVVIVTCAALVFLNSESVSTALRLASPGTRGVTAGGGRGVGHPMVQFYPDNQNKMLYRKSQVSNQERKIIDNGVSRSSHTNVIRDKLSAVKDKVGVPKNRLGAEYLVEKNSTILSYNVHLFYYAWYGTPKFDGK